MAIDRRTFIAVTALGTAHLAHTTTAGAQILPRTPNSAKLERGDLVWPKKPGAFVPYNSGDDSSPDENRKQWLAERDKILKQARGGNIANARSIEHELSRLSYEEFQFRYLNDQKPEQFTPYADGNIAAVGHVGIIDVDSDGRPHVIEALLNPGIVRQSYVKWLSERAGQIVWHGRLVGKDGVERARIATEAAKQVGKPYDFWNFNLDNDKGFYCSKLVWQSVFRSTGIAVDGNKNPARSFWLSPKQILYAKAIERLHDPGEYARG